jgi:hypothetical protein
MFRTSEIKAVHDHPTKDVNRFRQVDITRVVCIEMDNRVVDFLIPSIAEKNKFMKAMIWLMKKKKINTK